MYRGKAWQGRRRVCVCVWSGRVHGRTNESDSKDEPAHLVGKRTVAWSQLPGQAAGAAVGLGHLDAGSAAGRARWVSVRAVCANLGRRCPARSRGGT